MPATFHSSIVSKVLVVAVAIAMLLCSTGYAQEVPVPPSPSLMSPIDTPPSPDYHQSPQCQTLGLPLPECQSWCSKIGRHGGYLKADVCCCNP